MKGITELNEKFIQYCKNQRRFSPSTVKAYAFDMKCFIRFLNEMKDPVTECDKVTKETLELYLEYLVEEFAVKTLRRRIACVRAFFNYLEYEEILVDNPFQRFKMKIREPFKIPTTMSLEEVNRILATAYGESPTLMPKEDELSKYINRRRKQLPYLRLTSEQFLWARDISILELLFAGGLRVSELCSLSVWDVDMNQLAIRIKGKGNKERTVYLENREVIKALNRYFVFRQAAGVELEAVYVTKFGKPISTQAVRNMIDKYTKAAGIEKRITPHVFRHSFASLLLEEGVDIKYIQDFLGHSSIATTQIYLHTTSNQRRRIMATKHPRQKMLLSDAAIMNDIEWDLK